MLLVYLTFDMQITCQKSYCNSYYDFNAKIHFVAKSKSEDRDLNEIMLQTIFPILCFVIL